MLMNSKSIKALVKDYLSGLTFDPDYEFFKEQYDINLDYSDFLFFVKEVKRDIAISKEMAERYKLSESQGKLKDMVDFWIATFPKEFSVEELASVLIDTLQGVVSHGR